MPVLAALLLLFSMFARPLTAPAVSASTPAAPSATSDATPTLASPTPASSLAAAAQVPATRVLTLPHDHQGAKVYLSHDMHFSYTTSMPMGCLHALIQHTMSFQTISFSCRPPPRPPLPPAPPPAPPSPPAPPFGSVGFSFDNQRAAAACRPASQLLVAAAAAATCLLVLLL